MVDPWSSMDSSNSPLTDSGPSASEDCTPSTSSEPPHGPLDAQSPLSPLARRLPNPKDAKPLTTKTTLPKTKDKARSRDLTLDLETLEPDRLPRRPHFLDEDYQPPSKSNIECRIPKPHFLDHSPSPDEFDERSDITNPHFLDDEVDGDDNIAQKKAGALPKRQVKPQTSTYSSSEDRPHRTNYRTALHYGLESAARSSERDKRASQLYRGTWPGERDWTGHDSSSVRSFSSNGSSDCPRPSSNLDNKMDCVFSLISLLSLSPENNADLSAPLLEMSRSVESCIAMRQAGCIPLLVQLIHSKVPRDIRDRAAKALRNIIHTQTDDKAGRREARVWRLLEQVREYCYVLEDVVEARKDGKEIIEDDATKHPSQSVAALMKLSFDEEHRHVVCQLGGLQALAALVSGDQAAHGSRTDDNTCLTMRKYAGMTLTNLTFGDGNNKSLLCSFKDFMLALVEQLESPNDDMRQVTAAVLRNLSWRADTNSKQVLREVGAVKGLTKAAMTCQKEATLKSVLSALWNLTAHCTMNKVALCSVDGALGFLVDMLSYNSPTKTLAIVENAGGIMRNVSSQIAVREEYRQILRERNCLSVLLQHLKSPSLTVVSNSCGTLWNLSARCPLDQEFLWDHGAVPMLRSLIHSKHKMIAMGSSAALKNLLNSKPGKTHIISLDTTARSMNLPALPTLGARKQKALEQELDQNLAETCDNIEPATSPSTSNREEKNLFTATERQIAMNLERHRMTASSPLMGTLTSQISLSHSAHLASYLSCSNTLLKGAMVTRSNTSSSGNVNRSDSKDSVTSTHSDSVFERVMRTGKVPVPTPRSKDLMKAETGGEAFKVPSKQTGKDGLMSYPTQPPIPPPRSSTDVRSNYTESGYDVDQDSCDQPIDYSQKYSETKAADGDTLDKNKTSEGTKKDDQSTYGDYQETDLDQPTDYSLRYAEHQSETGSDSEPPGPSDTIKHFATEGTPYETPIIFSTATSMSDLRVIGKDMKQKTPSVKENPEIMTHSDEKDTCSIEDPPRHDNDLAATTPQGSPPEPEPKRAIFDTKFSSGMISPEKPVNYCDEGTPGYFSRVSSLSSVGEPTEEDCLAKKNAMATINVEPGPEEPVSSSIKDKEGCKAVTFARPPAGQPPGASPPAPEPEPQETPLMFSRSSSLGSLPDCEHDSQGSVLSEFSRLPSGLLSPSEIPDSPGMSMPQSPRPPAPAPRSPPESGQQSVFSERVRCFVVEHTPALLSGATSLSSLTIDDEPKARLVGKLPPDLPSLASARNQSQLQLEKDEMREHVSQLPPSSSTPNAPYKGTQTPSDICRVYFTEDTPAILSKAGSNSNLSALSIDSAPPELAEVQPEEPQQQTVDSSDSSNLSDANDVLEECIQKGIAKVSSRRRRPLADADTSDSSNLSDAGDLLEECIQKGIDKVVKNKGPPSDVSSVPYTARSDVYRSLPPYLRSSTETVKMSHEFARNARDSRSVSSERAPPLPPKLSAAAAPPPPPRHHAHRPRETRASRDADSTSSLSLDSFGSTDREIFEETVKAGLPHRARSPGSNSNDSFGSTDKEVFERCVRAGISKTRRPRSLDRRSRPRPDRRSSADPTPLAPRRAPPDPPAPRRVPPDPPAPRRAPEPPKNGPAPSAHRAPAGDAAPERACTGYKEHLSEAPKDTPPPGTEQDKRQLEQLKESTMSLEGTQARSEYKRLFGDDAPKRACTGSKHLSEAPKDTPPLETEQDKRQLEEARSEYKRLLDDAALARASTGSKHLSEAPKDTPPRETEQDKRQLQEGIMSLEDTQGRSEYKRLLDDACTGSKQHLSEAPDDTPHHETEQDKRQLEEGTSFEDTQVEGEDKRQLEGTSLDDTQTRSEYKRHLDDAAPKRACTGSKQHSSEAPDDTPTRETEQDKRQLEEGTSLEDTQVQDKRLLEEGSNVNLQPLAREKEHRYTEPEDKTLLREDSKSLNINSEGKETQSFSEHLKMPNEQSRVLSEEDNTQLDINTDNITKNTNDYQQPTDAHYTLHEHVRSTDGNSSEYQQPPEIHYEEDNLETRLDRREQINALDRPEEDLNSSNDVECELASLNRTKDAIDLDRSNESYADVTDEEEDERQVYSAASTLRDLHRSNEAYADIDDNEAGTKHNDRIDGNVNSTKLERANVNSASYYASDDDQNHRHDGNVNSSKLANVNSASYYASDDEQNDRLVGNVNSAKLERANVNSASYYASDDDTSRAHSVASTLNNRVEYEWVDIKQDTWEEHTCPDDVTFPTISSVHLDASVELPDLLEKRASTASTRPDLTNRLEGHRHHDEQSLALDESETNLDSLMAAAIEKEAARLAAQLKNSQFAMEASVTSLTSLDLDNVRPPSNLGSLLSLSASGHWDDSAQVSKKSKSRKKSLPVAFMVKRALSNSMHRDSSEHLDSIPVSFLDNVKPPSELEAMDMEGSMVSVASIVSEVAEGKERVPVVFDLKQPIQDFPLCSAFTSVFHDLDKVNPPSLFDEMAESTFEIDQTTAQQVFDDCVSNTLNVVTDIPSGSETCTPLPSDVSSVESTPKRHKSNYLTPKEKRHVSKDRYQTYTITDTMTENDIVEMEDEEFLTWTKSEEYVTATSESKSKRKISAKQRRLEDRARYQTQTVDIHNIITHESSQFKVVDPHIESLKQRLNAKKTMKQKRLEDAERFRTRTLSEDIPPSPTFVTKDANFENVETTTGYDSLSSNELNHQQLLDDRPREDDVFRDGDSGHNEDDFELNSTQMQTYTKSFRNYLPVIESPAAVDMCVVNNLKNIEMTASFKRTMQEQSDKNQHPSSGDFASYEGDSNSEDRGTESDQDSRPKPKIVKPARREESLDSNESLDKEQGSPKAIRGRKKALYVSPYRRTTAPPKKPTATATSTKPTPKTIPTPKTVANTKPGAKIPSKTPTSSKPPSANTSPKKSIPHRSPTKVAQKPVSIPIAGAKPLPLERQGTFTKEESSVPAKDLPIPDKKSCVPQYKATSPTKPVANTSPSRLPQLNRFTRPAPPKGNQKPTPKTTKRPVETAMKNSPSNHSLQSNDSGKTVTLASRSSRQGSTSSVNSVQSSKTKDVESKIANLWKKVEQSKKQPTKPDKRVWIESDKTEPPKLIRSSTFEGQPKPQVSSAQKQKSAIGIRVSQIPSLRPKSTSSKAQTSTAKKPTARVFARKPISGQVNS